MPSKHEVVGSIPTGVAISLGAQKKMPSKLEKKLLLRCQRCRLRPTLCLCGEFPAVSLRRTELCLVIHRQEGKSTTNTGLLAAEVLPGSRVLWRGGTAAGLAHERGEDPALTREQLFTPGRVPLLLFPEDDAEAVTDVWLARELEQDPARRFTLIVPDGTWSQARRVGRREPALAGVRHVTLAPGPLSEYRLRREHVDSYVCTFEAIARLLGVLEGQALRADLEHLFRKVVGRHLWGAGKLEAADVVGGIPEAAIEERLKSGYPSRY